MQARPGLNTSTQTDLQATHLSTRVDREGILAGIVGGATIALWFLILDTLAGRLLYTPSLLGQALFRGDILPTAAGDIPVSLGMVIAFSWVHWLVFAAIGTIASWLLAFAEREPSLGLRVLCVFLLIVFEFGFLGAAMFFSEVLLHRLAWEAVLIGNVLAAVAMGAYLWWRHPTLALQRITASFFSAE
jgi:hypothetical protein